MECIIVPVGSESIDFMKKKGYYLYPKGSIKRNVGAIYFYVSRPECKIKFYSIITKKIDDAEDLTNIYEKMKMFKDPTKEASAFKLKKVTQLSKPIVQGKKIKQRATHTVGKKSPNTRQLHCFFICSSVDLF